MCQILSSVARVQIQNAFTGLPKQWTGFECLALGMASPESLIQLPKIRRSDGEVGLEEKAQGGGCLAGSRWGPWVWHYSRAAEVRVVLQGSFEQLWTENFVGNSLTGPALVSGIIPQVWCELRERRGGERARGQIMEKMDGQRGNKEKRLYF